MRAFFANLFVAGLGYVYLGRVDLGLVAVAAMLAVVAVPGWTRVILEPWAVYAAALLAVAIVLWIQIHTVVLAVRCRGIPRKPYNTRSVYVFWTVCVLTLFNAMVDTWRYRGTPPGYGEIVVFNVPDRPGVKYVKRIAGMPGDRIDIREGVLHRNGEPVAEAYLHEPLANGTFGRDVEIVDLGPSEFYLLGDFRDNSRDSRSFGPVPAEDIHGRVEYVWFSIWEGEVNWQRFPKAL